MEHCLAQERNPAMSEHDRQFAEVSAALRALRLIVSEAFSIVSADRFADHVGITDERFDCSRYICVDHCSIEP
jgi:hypothetical protein